MRSVLLVFCALGLGLGTSCTVPTAVTKGPALTAASKQLKCPKKKLTYRVYKGGTGKANFVARSYYAVKCGKKRTCVECEGSDCKVYEEKTEDKCPEHIFRD